VQGVAADVWKENVIEELESEELEYESVEEFLTSLKKEFGGGEEESVKAAELRKLEQGGRMMEEFVQELKRVARGSRYEGRSLMEEFKRGMNRVIRRKLIEVENQPSSIEQWYRKAIALDRNWRESRREEGTRRRSFEAGAKTNNAMTLSVTEEANAFSAGNNRACSNRRSRKNEYSSGKRVGTEDGGSSEKRPLYYGSGLRKELLCLWGFQAHGPSLQELEKRKSDGREKSGI